MESLWRRVASLRGKTVSMVTGRPFYVLKVDPSIVWAVMISTGTGNVRYTRRQEIEGAYRFAQEVGRAVRPNELRSTGYSTWNRSFVAAIVNTIRRLE